MSANFHPIVYIIDYFMGMIMWTLIGRVAMNIFQREDSSFFFYESVCQTNRPNYQTIQFCDTLFHNKTSSSTICCMVFLHV